ncbi:PHP domain-containing protein [Ruminococcaceae bacterium OttesenSCG-928-L11]|nr:PHP domain-containing protein [Ruminococcaceae bacterium OttesenSCG-928-L11]
MLRIGVDMHTHTMFSGHAYCTVRDNVLEAKDHGLEGIGIADHYGEQFLNVDVSGEADPGKMFGAMGHLFNVTALPREWHGVRIYRSVEADICDARGNIFGHQFMLPSRNGKVGTLADAILGTTDYAIASVHFLPNLKEITADEGTAMYCKALENPKVMMLGHIGRAGVAFHIDEVLKAAREKGKIIEINDHSFDFEGPIADICRKIAIRCAELGVWIAVNSDAHCSASVGVVTNAMKMLEEIGFPQELVANESAAKLDSIIAKATA